jgi:hypothetical protein
MTTSPSIPDINTPTIYHRTNSKRENVQITQKENSFRKKSIVPPEYDVENGILGLGDYMLLLVIRSTSNLSVVRNVFFFFLFIYLPCLLFD